MAGDLTSVKQDDRNVVAVTREEFRVLGDIHVLQRELNARLYAAQTILRSLAEMATGPGINGYDMIHRGWFMNHVL